MRKPLDVRTLRAVARWHGKRRGQLNWAGMRSTVPGIRETLFAQAEAHENSRQHWLGEARAISKKSRRAKK